MHLALAACAAPLDAARRLAGARAGPVRSVAPPARADPRPMDDGEERVAEALLASLAVEHYEPEVVGVVLEQMHRTVQALLSDARDLALHSGRDAVSARDVRKVDELAAEDGYSARPLPSREAMLEMARVVNEKRIELPDSHGVRLPADDAGKLSARGYALEPNGKVVTKKGP